IDCCNQPPYGGLPTPLKQVISIFGGVCSQVWFPVVDVTLQNEKKPFTLKYISAMILGKMKQTARTYLSERVTHAIVTVPASFNDAFIFVSCFTSAFRCQPAMHQDQLSDLKYAELHANAK
ncbi:ATPase with role in protein import into the ER, partial [Tulasnella sp. 417]